jgi:hypothetical protein
MSEAVQTVRITQKILQKPEMKQGNAFQTNQTGIVTKVPQAGKKQNVRRNSPTETAGTTIMQTLTAKGIQQEQILIGTI